MTVTLKDVLKSIVDWMEEDKKERQKAKDPDVGYPMFGFSAFSYSSDEIVVSEADKKLAVAEAALEEYVALNVEKTIRNMMEQTQQPSGHPLYPEENQRRQQT